MEIGIFQIINLNSKEYRIPLIPNPDPGSPSTAFAR